MPTDWTRDGLRGGSDHDATTPRPGEEGRRPGSDRQDSRTGLPGGPGRPAGPAGDELADRVRALERKAATAETRAARAEEVAARVFALAGVAHRIRDGPETTVTDAGSIETLTAVVDALAAEIEVSPATIVRCMIEDIEGRMAVDGAVLDHLRRLEERDTAGDPHG